jgi:branched-subunit amino acid aminotransferase/4-amino-4-deoxychorismate lyase
MNYCSVNGKIITLHEAGVSLNDLGLTRGVGMFDFLRVEGHRPLYLDDHLARLQNGMKAMGFSSIDHLSDGVHELLNANAWEGTSGLRILVTGGPSLSLDDPQIVMTQERVTPPAEDDYYDGASLLLDEYQRELPEVKSTNYLHAVMLYKEMVKISACDILYHLNGNVTECARSNFFIVKDGQLITSADHVLRGITRKQVLDIASDHVKILEKQVTLEDVLSSDEVFITSTIKRILPISRISQLDRIWNPGPVTRDLMNRLAERDLKESES